LDCINNLLIAGTAADVAADRLTDLRLVRTGILAQQGMTRDQHALRTVAALQRMLLTKSVLQRRERLSFRRQALDRRNGVALGLNRKHAAGANRLSIKQNTARTAHAMLAANMRAR